MARTVQVDPSDQPIPSLVIERHTVVPFLQQLNQFARVRVVFTRHQQVDVVFDVDTTDVRDQRFVGRCVTNRGAAELALGVGM